MDLRVFLAAAAAAGVASTSFGQFGTGQLVVLEASQGGTGTMNSTAAAQTLRGFQPGVGFTGFNVTIANGNFGDRQTIAGSSTSEGFLNLSANGQFLITGGYDAARGAGASPFPTGTGSIATTTTAEANRMVGITTLAGATTLHRISDTFSGANMRTAASVDGSSFFAISSRDGVRFLNPSAGTTTSPASGGTPALANIRSIDYTPFTIAGGHNGLVLSANSTAGGLVGLGSLVGGVITPLPGLGAIGGSPYEFVFADADTLYIADDSSLGTNGGLRRFDFDASLGTWVQSYRITGGLTLGLRALTIDPVTGTLYAVQAGSSAGGVTSLVSVVDTGASSSFSLLATSAAGSAYRGVQFVPTPGAAGLLGLGALATLRRRRA